jgi:hypothetical protein
VATFISRLESQLEQFGLSSTQAKAIISEMLEGEKDSSMASRWQDDPEEYPESMFGVIWLICKHYASAYIDRVCPEAWFRPCFM